MVWICICTIWYAPLMYYGMDMHMYGCPINILWCGYAYVWYDVPLIYYGVDMHMYDMMPH